MTTAKDLTKEAPRSPRIRIGDYALMARMIDKGRATLNGTVGEYHFACPLEHVRTRIPKAKNGLLENAQRSDLIRLRPPSSIISKPTIA